MPISVLLRCTDLEATRVYYRDTLGFAVSDSEESTLTVQLEDCRLVFTRDDLWGSVVACSGTFYCAISQVDRYFESIKDKASIAWPLQDMPYGAREFGIRDCNGYYLAFTQVICNKM